MTFKEFFSLKRNKLFWGNIIAMIVVVVALVMGTLKWLDAYTHHGEAVVVPDVADNSSVREAQARLLAAGFKLTPNDSVPGEQDWVYYVRHGEDTLAVDDQVPTGATLTLIIGNGEPIPVPTDSLATDSLGLMRDSIVTDLPEDESWF